MKKKIGVNETASSESDFKTGHFINYERPLTFNIHGNKRHEL